MFGEDAERGAEILGITLTKRGGAALAGVPYHALSNYLAKALKAGVKIAICEQTETAQAGKLVPRAIVRIVTAGTNFDETQLDAKSNNYILAVDENKRGLHAAWIDATTGDFYIASSREPQNCWRRCRQFVRAKFSFRNPGSRAMRPIIWSRLSSGISSRGCRIGNSMRKAGGAPFKSAECQQPRRFRHYGKSSRARLGGERFWRI